MVLEKSPNAGASAQAILRSQQSALTQARVRLFLVLGIIYLLAVVLLESAIMPYLSSYRPFCSRNAGGGFGHPSR